MRFSDKMLCPYCKEEGEDKLNICPKHKWAFS